MRLEDLYAIEQLQRRFALLNDAAEWEQLALLFAEDATFARPSSPDEIIAGRAAILQSFRTRPKSVARRHIVAPGPTRATGTDGASGMCRSLLLTFDCETEGTVTLGGFVDTFRRDPEGWRFTSRAGFTSFEPVRFVAAETLPTLWESLSFA